MILSNIFVRCYARGILFFLTCILISLWEKYLGKETTITGGFSAQGKLPRPETIKAKLKKTLMRISSDNRNKGCLFES